MEKTDLDMTVLDDLDFSIDCEANIHDEYGQGPAVAFIRMRLPCCGTTKAGFICQGCLDRVMNSTDRGRHRMGCGGTWTPYRACITSVTPI